jgi:hypothetical protein
VARHKAALGELAAALLKTIRRIQRQSWRE